MGLICSLHFNLYFVPSRCGPRLSEAAAEKLKNRYVLMRSGVREHEMESEKRLNIPITVRYCIFMQFNFKS